MAAEGTAIDPDEVLVTTGGQQVIDLVCKTLIDPGDVIVAEAPDLPRRGARRSAPTRPTSCRSRWTATACAIDELEATLDRLERAGRRPKFIYTVPNFQNPAGVTMSLRAPRAARADRRASASCWCSRTTPTACCATRATPLPTLRSLDGGEFVIYPARSRRSSRPGCGSGWAVAPRAGAREAEPRQAGRRTSAPRSISQYFVAAYFDARATWQELRALADRDLPAPARRDARRAGRALPARGRVDAPAGRPVHLGDAARLHRHDRPAGAGAARSTSRSCPAAPRSSTAAAAPRCG